MVAAALPLIVGARLAGDGGCESDVGEGVEPGCAFAGTVAGALELLVEPPPPLLQPASVLNEIRSVRVTIAAGDLRVCIIRVILVSPRASSHEGSGVNHEQMTRRRSRPCGPDPNSQRTRCDFTQ